MLKPTAVWNSHRFNCWEKRWAAGCLVRRSVGKARVETRRLSVLSEPQDQTKAENLQVLETLWYFLRSCGESCEKFCEEIAKWDLEKWAAQPPWIKIQELCDSTETPRVSSVAPFILFDVRMRNNSSHERWKSSEFSPFLLCFTQGLGLSTYTKVRSLPECSTLLSMNDRWKGTKPEDFLKRRMQPQRTTQCRLIVGFNLRSQNRRHRFSSAVH